MPHGVTKHSATRGSLTAGNLAGRKASVFTQGKDRSYTASAEENSARRIQNGEQR